ncbi:hypothetical protein SLS64_005885 [Diaporthe eres]|uniref:Uncharacterized protein n=1 Tax=Diaporthe eres TaxID=83184 RepID=A0ABR1NXY7_DIAER
MDYSVPEQTKQLLIKGVLENPLIASHLPTGAAEAASKISFTGSDLPSIPVNWRFAESISALKAFEAILVNVLLKRKYGLEPVSITIDTIDMPHDMEFQSMPEASAAIGEAVGKLTADELQHRAADIYKQAGTVCYTREQFRESEHGKANAHVGLFEIREHPNPQQKPCWWPDAPQTSAERPLAGLKVVDLSRVIAAPAITRGLAELGASVMRIVAPHLPDMSALHFDLNHGKWNALLDLREKADRATLRELIHEADVFVQGYRPGVLDKYGFGETDILQMVQDRGRGIIYVRENCYGWNGPWKERSGWQQISDANCGVSYEFGRAMGNDEPITPVFPNSDYCVGMYPDPVWQDLWKSNGSLVFRHDQPMQTMLAAMMQTIMKHSANKLFRPHHFTTYYCRYLQKDVKLVAPILQFPQGEVKPGYSVGTRTNGVDKPRWPGDLTVEMVE